jgi:hypothetical protein
MFNLKQRKDLFRLNPNKNNDKYHSKIVCNDWASFTPNIRFQTVYEINKDINPATKREIVKERWQQQ